MALGDLVWPQAKFFYQEAELGFGNQSNSEGASTRGICLWMSPKLGHMITEPESSGCGRG